jgi:hypothetical protein
VAGLLAGGGFQRGDARGAFGAFGGRRLARPVQVRLQPFGAGGPGIQ